MDPNTVRKDGSWKISGAIRQQGRENQAARAAEAEVKKAEAVAEAEAERRLRKKPNEARLRAMAAEDYEEQRYFHRISKASEGAAAAKQVEDDVKEIKSHLCDVFRQIKEHFKKIEDRVNQMEENMKNLRQDVQEQKLLMRAIHEIKDLELEAGDGF